MELWKRSDNSPHQLGIESNRDETQISPELRLLFHGVLQLAMTTIFRKNGSSWYGIPNSSSLDPVISRS
jgi:hypothetical protein